MGKAFKTKHLFQKIRKNISLHQLSTKKHLTTSRCSAPQLCSHTKNLPKKIDQTFTSPPQLSTDRPALVLLDPEGPFALVLAFFSKPRRDGRLIPSSQGNKGRPQSSGLFRSFPPLLPTLPARLPALSLWPRPDARLLGTETFRIVALGQFFLDLLN